MEMLLMRNEASEGGCTGSISLKRRRRETAQDDGAKVAKRSSRFRGVSRHRWTGRYEAHLWDKLSWNVTQNKKGKQVYLGAYDDEEAAARAYDLAALKYWGTSTLTNFPISDYEKEVVRMQTLTKEEYLATLRRKGSGFSRRVSKLKGVARHHLGGKWEARIGRVCGNKYLYLGTYGTQEEAARAYDIAAIAHRGIGAVTNFDMSSYIELLKPRMHSQSEASPTKPSFQMKQESIPSNYHRKPSSPTALDLLLRSRVFRDLVEKNSSASEDESSDDENVQQNEYGSVFSCANNNLQQIYYRDLDFFGVDSFGISSSDAR